MKNMKREASRVGFVVTRDREGFYHVYDVKAGYDVLVTAFRDSVVRMIQDEKAMIAYANRKIVEPHSPICGA